MKTVTRIIRPKRQFYAVNVNMNYSFDTLLEMANKLLGADKKSLEEGDILICDNHKGDKRKVLQVTKDGLMIYYGRLNDERKFEKLADHNGVLKKVIDGTVM